MEIMIPLRQGPQSMYEQIYQYMKTEIRKGNLREGVRLPSTRVLAENLKVSRSTTQMAYDQLVAEGYIEALPHKGYFVLRMEELVEVEPEIGGTFIEEKEEDNNQAEIDFSPRGIDLTHFPYNIWRKVTRNTLAEDKKEMFLTGSPQGESALREAIRGYLHSARGVNCQADQIIVGAGSEYLLMLLYQILGPGRVVAMENPTYKQAYRVFESLGYEMAPVEMDSCGMEITFLEKTKADIAYVMPSHQYPTGIVMPVLRRQELLQWAGRKKDRFLIEDDYDSEFRYKGKPIPALQGSDGGGRVIYLGTFSKSIAPSMRISYMALPHRLLDAYAERGACFATTVSRVDQRVMERFLREGYFERHLNRMRGIYKNKHDVLVNSLRQKQIPCRIFGEHAGVHLMLRMENGMGEEEARRRAAEKGVKVYGLSEFIRPDSRALCKPALLLGYAGMGRSNRP